jgi:CheY-like chemotaxis protein
LEPKVPVSATQRATPAFAGARVLVVEDNPVNQKVASSALRRLGWQSDVASNGLIALEMVRRGEYAVLLMDCQMRGLDGYSTAQQIRSWERSKIGQRFRSLR